MNCDDCEYLWALIVSHSKTTCPHCVNGERCESRGKMWGAYEDHRKEPHGLARDGD